MQHGDTNLDSVATEYKALRDEMLLRLKAQQDLIHYTFLVAGLVAPLVGLRQTIGLRELLVILLFGPWICVFLQMVYLKHHIYLQMLAHYTRCMGGNHHGSGQNDKCPFSGWELYVTRTLNQERTPNILSAILGFAEGGFPTLIGMLYVVVFILVAQPAIHDIWHRQHMIVWLFFADIAALLVAVLAGILVRHWAVRLRQSTVSCGKKQQKSARAGRK